KGEIIGYYTNIERVYVDPQIHGNKIHGVMPFIILKAIEKFKTEGIETISLGLSPLYKIQENSSRGHAELTELLRQFFEHSELYAFRGLAQHKAKYPEKIEVPVFFASKKDSTIEDLFNIFVAIGIIGSDNGFCQGLR
ncbi:MAG: phosphatidylglycerol lysyltransferase domain-containing protein, partial [Thermodesulfobacteriota bacterium]